MKPFNLKDAIAGKPITTRNDHFDVRILCTDLKNPIYTVVAALTYRGLDDNADNDYGETIEIYTPDGIYDVDQDDCPLDLVMASEKTTKWVNVYRVSDNSVYKPGNILYDTEEEAVERGGFTDYYLGTYPVEIEI